MNLIRPELSANLRRWREALAALAAAALGGWFLWRGLFWRDWLLIGLGVLVLVASLGAAYVAVQRARFRTDRDGTGPGIVRVTERRIAYLGPVHGGAVSLRSVGTVELVTGRAGRYWLLSHSDGPPLMIPVDASGAGELFDAFTALPGLDPARLARAVEHAGERRVVVWSGNALPEA